MNSRTILVVFIVLSAIAFAVLALFPPEMMQFMVAILVAFIVADRIHEWFETH